MRHKPLFLNKVAVKKSHRHGYGVFALKKIKKGELIEECYIVITKGGDRGFEDYYFDAKGKHAIFLGYGCIYNHSDEPNTNYTINISKKIARFVANKDIKKNEEICVSYGDKWFSDRDLKVKRPKHE